MTALDFAKQLKHDKLIALILDFKGTKASPTGTGQKKKAKEKKREIDDSEFISDL